ncbi:DUF397 domain-containing protein [Actinomadura sp. 3N508]|uniref:DUF397 domain-containing protein n=1 Tax=Actinomadura sp. 3N508 TaxID=3375153 RepID=UPI0037B00165
MPAANTTWRKSSRSAECTSGQCVEFAVLSGMLAIRDSMDPGGPKLMLTATTTNTR